MGQTIQQAADRLGVSRALVARWVKEGRIPGATWNETFRAWELPDEFERPAPRKRGRKRADFDPPTV